MFKQVLSFISPVPICAERHKAAGPPHTRWKAINSGWPGMKHMLFKETAFWCFPPTKSEQELQQLISNGSYRSLLPNICAHDYTSLPSLVCSLTLLGSAMNKERGEGCYPVPYLNEKNPWDIWSCIKSPPKRSLAQRWVSENILITPRLSSTSLAATEESKWRWQNCRSWDVYSNSIRNFTPKLLKTTLKPLLIK